MTLWCEDLIFLYFLTPCRSKVITPLWYVDPLQKQGHFCVWLLTPYRSKVLAILWFLTHSRSKVTIILWCVDPLQNQGHICFRTWSPTEARSWPFYGIDSLQKQSHNHSLLFDSLRSKVTIILWYVDPLQKQGHICLLALDLLQKQGLSHSLFSSLCAKGLKVVSTLYFSVHVWEKTQQISTFYFF